MRHTLFMDKRRKFVTHLYLDSLETDYVVQKWLQNLT
jgi:hypothetical protein